MLPLLGLGQVVCLYLKQKVTESYCAVGKNILVILFNECT
jgi:hypothetical protein